jgi:hypothetical protein
LAAPGAPCPGADVSLQTVTVLLLRTARYPPNGGGFDGESTGRCAPKGLFCACPMRTQVSTHRTVTSTVTADSSRPCPARPTCACSSAAASMSLNTTRRLPRRAARPWPGPARTLTPSRSRYAPSSSPMPVPYGASASPRRAASGRQEPSRVEPAHIPCVEVAVGVADREGVSARAPGDPESILAPWVDERGDQDAGSNVPHVDIGCGGRR